MKQTKEKKYKYFNFPNDLTSLEQYLYYAWELGIISRQLSVEDTKTLFDKASEDYIEGFLSTRVFSSIVGSLYFVGSMPTQMANFKPELSWLMHFCADLDYIEQKDKEDYKKLMTRLKKYLRSPKKYKDDWLKKFGK